MKTASWLNHLEYDRESPVWSPVFYALAGRYRLIRYDGRDNGLSDQQVEDISFEAFVRDLETVADAAKLERFALLGVSQGAAVAVAYAVRYPERVSHLVLYGGYMRGKRRRGAARETEQADAISTLIRDGWGQDNPAFRQIFTSLFIPGGTPEQVQWWNDLQRKTTSPENAVRIRRACDDIDVSELLPRVQVPTLILHCRDDAVQPFDESRRLAAGIPDARFVALEGRNHVILQGDPGLASFPGRDQGFPADRRQARRHSRDGDLRPPRRCRYPLTSTRPSCAPMPACPSRISRTPSRTGRSASARSTGPMTPPGKALWPTIATPPRIWPWAGRSGCAGARTIHSSNWDRRSA